MNNPSPLRDSRFSVYWDHCISILPRKCYKTNKLIKPFTRAWRRTDQHKYLLFKTPAKWYCDEYIVWARLKGEL